MELFNGCRALNLASLGARCKDLYDSLDMQKALFPLIKGKCPHFGVVKDFDGEFKLIYAGVTNRFKLDLEQMQKIVDLFRRYENGNLIVEESGLDSFQVTVLAGYEFGVASVLNMSTRMVEISLLQFRNTSKRYSAKKEPLALLPLEWDG